MFKHGRVVYFLFLTAILILDSGCFKHRRQIRVRNNFSTALTVKVGPADFGAVGSVKTTDYKDIPKGVSEITGDVKGTIDVPSGKHKYTLNINSVGAITLIDENQ